MFRTEISDFDTQIKITHQSDLLSMGSCFASEIGERLLEHKFRIDINPGGILFNPMSIFNLMSLALGISKLPGSSYLEREGRYFNYHFHSDVNASSKEALEENIQNILTTLSHALQRSELIILTFGTAWQYQLKEDNTMVANCHKIPQSNFKKSLLAPLAIPRSFDLIQSKVRSINPKARFLLTVSPVRHIKDTIPLNSVSKSVLRWACHHLAGEYPHVEYFPSFELMMDDLRDYRFYKKDMIHPNEQAIDYIWDKFSNTYFSRQSLDFVHDWAKIRSALAHKPFQPQSDAHQRFLKKTLKKVESYTGMVDVSEEVAFLKTQITHT